MARKSKANAAFTLIELMITVAIIGILATTAITLFTEQQMRSKRSEAMTNVEALVKMMRGAFGETGAYPEVAVFWPAPPIDAKADPWDPASTAAYGRIGFKVDGSVRFHYDADAFGDCGCVDCFTVVAFGDLDGDGQPSGVGYFQPDGTGWACPSRIGAFLPEPGQLKETHFLKSSGDRY